MPRNIVNIFKGKQVNAFVKVLYGFSNLDFFVRYAQNYLTYSLVNIYLTVLKEKHFN